MHHYNLPRVSPFSVSVIFLSVGREYPQEWVLGGYDFGSARLIESGSVLSHMKDAVLQALEAIFELFGDTSDVKRPPQRPA
jgi:hypothetical protein